MHLKMAYAVQTAKKLKQFFVEIGELSYFAMRFFKEVFKPPWEFKELLRQCYNMGNRSFVLVGVTGFIIGLVLTLQSRPTLLEFGAVSMDAQYGWYFRLSGKLAQLSLL